MVLRVKFNLVMLAAFGLSLAVAYVVSTRISAGNARRQVLAEATVMMTAASATMHYTDTQVTPLLDGHMNVQFLPQGVPFFAARQTLELLAKSFPGYSFRQPALNPTNPGDKATAPEAEIIHAFAADPSRGSLVGEQASASGAILSYAQPVRVSDKSCLACHSTPGAAPASMIDAYGSQNGFGWKLGDVVGAIVVFIPEEFALSQARSGRYALMAATAGVFAGVLVLLNVLLHLIVIAPLRRMARIADEVSLGNTEVAEFDEPSTDEIGSLSKSFNRMRRSLVAAMGMLEG